MKKIFTTLPDDVYQKIKENGYRINQLILLGLKQAETIKEIKKFLTKLDEEMIIMKKDIETLKSAMQFLIKYVGKS